ncbi:MAG TPA: N-acetylglucosamine-specific PTS transporter subunit IIBC [Usitatibacter sp.]
MMKNLIENTQKLGRALMLPIAVLPVAGLLLRLGQPDLLNLAPIAAAGDAIFYNLGILFAIGIAVGLARENHGAAGLAGAVAYFVAAKGAEVLLEMPAGAAAGAAADKIHKLNVPLGILSGIIAGALYNRYQNIKLPDYLAFFGGRRFVPIAAGMAGLVLAFAFGLGFPILERGMDTLSVAVTAAGSVGLFIYGVLNRILIVTGLHHILNNVAWFILGDFHGKTGDLNRFFAGDPSAGAFMSGFFPVMMFGLPAACLAMYRTAAPEKRVATGGLLLSMALTSFLTGVTEPIEFTFMFLAPALYAVHAVLTGLAMVVMDLLNVRLGFGFSAGLFDYVLNFKLATHPLYLIPVGLLYFGVYYSVFRYFILRFNLATPGRGADDATAAPPPVGDAERADRFVVALGGAQNLREVEACTTRLRLVLADRTRIDVVMLKSLGSRGTVNVGDAGLQVVVGPIADQVASDIRSRLSLAPSKGPAAAPTQGPAISAAMAPAPDAGLVLSALGGKANISRVEPVQGRVLVTVKERARVDLAALRALFIRGVAAPGETTIHLLHPDATAIAARL